MNISQLRQKKDIAFMPQVMCVTCKALQEVTSRAGSLEAPKRGWLLSETLLKSTGLEDLHDLKYSS